ncbi:MAG: thioesterase family protein [Acidobacteria bacterium]|nr:thioesterase family protein [Acidobacteriota bacterium]
MTRGTASFVVEDEHTAIAIRSGDVPVLATPWLIALCERATVAAAAGMLAPDETTVGVRIDIEHLAATPPGATVTATAEIVTIDDARLVFSVTAHQGTNLIGRGTIVRTRVNRKRFLARVKQP